MPFSLLCFPVVLVIKDEDPVTLSCNTTIDSNITWKFHGEVTEDVALEDGVQQNGKNLTLSDVGANMLGEYTCWAEGQKLSSIYLLRKAEEESKIFLFHFSYILLLIGFKCQDESILSA